MPKKIVRRAEPEPEVIDVALEDFQTESVVLDELKEHPRNYKEHPDDQLEHLIQSIRDHGFYKNIVIARDGTILAGHGVVKAARKMGHEKVPVIRLDLDPDDPRALKLLVGDNELSHLAEIDDRVLTEMLKEIGKTDLSGLLGTGYDEKMLANLAMVTRPASEIRNNDAAAEWVGMPEHTPAADHPRVHVSFKDEADRDQFLELISASIVNKKVGKIWAIWWPEREREDLSSVRFEG